ncbi:MAG: T9SS type A sorting domain-containing protein [Flavobacterium sp.]|nr:MAG: T9SS type A sorting domain-containing protein [Flavobacterium sp.]
MNLKLRIALYGAVLGLCSANPFSAKAQGFGTTATNWGLPAGGHTDNGTNYSFNEISEVTGAAYDLGSQAWTVMDMNGDSKLDIVVYSENLAAGDALVYGSGSNRYWKVYFGTATGFSTTATNWTLPVGGHSDNGINYSFDKISQTTGAAYDLGSQSWTVMDMNGDSKPDMVVYNENMAAGDAWVYGSGSNRYWKVYLNTGSGFSPTATNWTLPAGGHTDNGINYSFNKIAQTTGAAYDLGSQSWTVMDMNGDSKLDLVVYNENMAAGDALVYGSGSNRYWKVYLNTTSGFSSTATNWALPAGGHTDNGINYSFHQIAQSTGAAYDLGSQSWTVMDMNGDSKPDLVVYNENMAAGDALVYGSGSNRYWKVYLNTTSGFSPTATNWTLPVGGHKDNGVNYSFHQIAQSTGAAYDLGSQSWTVMDMNGDAKLDLVVYNENQTAGDALVYGSGANRYWKVYSNSTSGFSATATNWSLPVGGHKDNGVDYSFYQIAESTGAAYDLGSQAWTVMDMNGDHKPDLVVYNENMAAGDALVYGSGSSRYWKVYLGSGSLAVPTVAKDRFVVYPNPVSETLFVKAATAGSVYELFDGNGRVVRAGDLSGETNAVDVSGVLSGVYFLRIDGEVLKVVKK